VKAGVEYFQVTPFDKILIVRKGADYFVTKAPEKLFVDKGMLACVMADKELLTDIIFTVIYRTRKAAAPMSSAAGSSNSSWRRPISSFRRMRPCSRLLRRRRKLCSAMCPKRR
jgi:hypothetical protein